MSRYFTLTANLAEVLFNLHTISDTNVFEERIQKILVQVINSDDSYADNKKRIVSLGKQFFDILFENRKELSIEHTLDLARLLKKENTLNGLKRSFTKKIISVLTLKEAQSKLFSEKIIQYLKKISNKELKQLTVQVLSERFQFSSPYFSKKFQDEQGMTIHDMIIYEKINRAYSLLKENRNLSVQELANELGFSDRRYFSRLFREKFGMLPSEVTRLRDYSHIISVDAENEDH